MKHFLSERYFLWYNKLGILVKGSSVSATLMSGGSLTPFFYQTPRHRLSYIINSILSKIQEILQYLYEWFAIVDDSLLSSSL